MTDYILNEVWRTLNSPSYTDEAKLDMIQAMTKPIRTSEATALEAVTKQGGLLDELNKAVLLIWQDGTVPTDSKSMSNYLNTRATIVTKIRQTLTAEKAAVTGSCLDCMHDANHHDLMTSKCGMDRCPCKGWLQDDYDPDTMTSRGHSGYYDPKTNKVIDG